MHPVPQIKICGLTRIEDIDAAVAAGVNALGFVFYPKSPRYVGAAAAAKLLAAVPPFITTVGLFVNAAEQEVKSVLAQAPVSLLQFHGDETLQQCCAIAHAVNRRFIRALRIPSTASAETISADLLESERSYRAASSLFAGLLLDTLVAGYGGGGKVFDWSVIPKELAPRVVLSGGLNEHNVTEAMRQVRPCAVDVSSGVEQDKGIKDAAKIRRFVEAVRAA